MAKTVDFSKIGETIEAKEIKTRAVGKWRKDLIVEFLRWCEKNLSKDKAKILTIEEIFKTFYSPNSETLDDIKNDPKRMNSFVRTFVKTANKIVREQKMRIHIGIHNKQNIKIQKIEK